jgi:hypothetical protein
MPSYPYQAAFFPPDGPQIVAPPFAHEMPMDPKIAKQRQMQLDLAEQVKAKQLRKQQVHTQNFGLHRWYDT